MTCCPSSVPGLNLTGEIKQHGGLGPPRVDRQRVCLTARESEKTTKRSSKITNRKKTRKLESEEDIKRENEKKTIHTAWCDDGQRSDEFLDRPHHIVEQLCSWFPDDYDDYDYYDHSL